MRRLLIFLAFLVMVLACGLTATTTTVYVVTGKGPVTALRDGALLLILSRRTDELTTAYSNDDTAVRFTVEPGTPTRQIAQNLLSAGLIGDAELFVNYTAANDIDIQLEAGTYFLAPNMPITEIAQRLTDANSSRLTFRILEGWRLEEIANAIDQNGLFGFTGTDFLAVVDENAAIPSDFAAFTGIPAGTSLEGFLYPDTYVLPPGVTPTELRDILLDTFRQRVTPDLVASAAAQNFTLYDVVILASISEREAVHATEHPQILSVYRNRLEIGMKLDADPTIQYALDNTRGSWWGQITRADYQGVNSPYNTYLQPGLPPGPISNPGIDAIRAAIEPAETDYLFFRAACSGSGYHEFAVTYDEHLQNGCTG
jgi:UPF0755 protein